MITSINGFNIDIMCTDTVIVGSGCAALNCADWLADLGKKDMLLITEGMNCGTSRNAGSDKQTYYKLSLAGDKPDCIMNMTNDLICEGVNGDTALVEAACSVQSFFKLIQLGVPFPTNEYGEFIGYQTDHDRNGRASSAGPLTSKIMTECLERSVREKQIPIMDNTTVFQIFKRENKVEGVLAWNSSEERLKLIRASHVVLATGGPASIYSDSVYPLSQQGMTGMAVDVGAQMANLHQWQYGLASVKFRWNVSGSYQQVLPRYISIDENGCEREFLDDAFSFSEETMYNIFLKGYQWPFDIRKIRGSSMIDLLVHQENCHGRKVYLDFRRNPSVLKQDLSNLPAKVREYLEARDALYSTPYERLLHINAPAIQLYRDHGIDIEKEPLEVRVCAQHHNGGIAVDENWQTSITGLFAVGEAAGTFGAYRPGGSALNSTQVGSMRAAQAIMLDKKCPHFEDNDIDYLLTQIALVLDHSYFPNSEEIGCKCREYMSKFASHVRDLERMFVLDKEIDTLLTNAEKLTADKTSKLLSHVRLRDQLITQRSVLSAMLFAAEVYGSTGAGLVLDKCSEEKIPKLGINARAHREVEENIVIRTEHTNTCAVAARKIPQANQIFETAWKTYRERFDGIYNNVCTTYE